LSASSLNAINTTLAAPGGLVYQGGSGYPGPELLSLTGEDTDNSNVMGQGQLVMVVDNPPTVGNATGYSVNAGSTLSGSSVLGVSSPYTAILVQAPMHGQITFKYNGTFSYAANVGYIGIDTFTFEAFDGKTYSQPMTATINDTKPISFVKLGVQPDAGPDAENCSYYWSGCQGCIGNGADCGEGCDDGQCGICRYSANPTTCNVCPAVKSNPLSLLDDQVGKKQQQRIPFTGGQLVGLGPFATIHFGTGTLKIFVYQGGEYKDSLTDTARKAFEIDLKQSAKTKDDIAINSPNLYEVDILQFATLNENPAPKGPAYRSFLTKTGDNIGTAYTKVGQREVDWTNKNNILLSGSGVVLPLLSQDQKVRDKSFIDTPYPADSFKLTNIKSVTMTFEDIIVLRSQDELAYTPLYLLQWKANVTGARLTAIPAWYAAYNQTIPGGYEKQGNAYIPIDFPKLKLLPPK
jgi:Bacterial Ig domain